MVDLFIRFDPVRAVGQVETSTFGVVQMGNARISAADKGMRLSRMRGCNVFATFSRQRGQS